MSSAGPEAAAHTAPSPTADSERRRRLVRILRFFIVLLVFLLGFLPLGLGFASIWFLTHQPCGAGSLPEAHGMPDYERVAFYAPALQSDVQGYFVHGTNGVTIIIPPALGSGAGNWLPEYVALNRYGYNLFNYESRNCAGHANSLGYLEVEQVGDALRYLSTRPDVDMARIGIHGFSAAGATSIMAAARYPQIRAVTAFGGYHDFKAHLDAQTEGTWYGWLYNTGATWAYRLSTGEDISVLSPVSVIGQIAPRPIQLIYGTREPTLSGAYEQLAAAGSNADLWIVENATHGAYWINAPEAFEQQVVHFFDAAFGVDR